MSELHHLADLIKQRNVVAREIAGVIDRPASIGHVGEFIASQIFHIRLHASASNKAIDGHFTQGPLAGKSVNIKFYGKLESILDITPNALPDYYLVMTGAKAQAVSSRGAVRPWAVEHVFLFHAESLVEKLTERDLRIGVATSIRTAYWREAEIFPSQRNSHLSLSDEQRVLLSLFQASSNERAG